MVVHADLMHLAEGLDLPMIVVQPAPHIVEAYGQGAAPEGQKGIEWATLLQQPPIEEPAKAARDPIVYTSGTTGKPKGVRRFPAKSNQQAAAMRRHLISAFGLTDARRLLAASPLYHSGPFSYLRAAMAEMGDDGRVVIVPKFEAEQILALIQEHRIDHMWMVPTMFLALLRLPEQIRGALRLQLASFHPDHGRAVSA